MSESMVSKNYLLGAKLSFLIISFIVCIVAFTVQNDIWPFLETNLPPEQSYQLLSFNAVIIGLVLPGVWLCMDWSDKILRYGLLSFIIMFLMQIMTELLVGRYFFISMIIPTSILYSGYRIIQLINLQRVVYKTRYLMVSSKLLRTLIVGMNLVFWSLLWFKLTFFTFPQIIPQIF